MIDGFSVLVQRRDQKQARIRFAETLNTATTTACVSLLAAELSLATGMRPPEEEDLASVVRLIQVDDVDIEFFSNFVRSLAVRCREEIRDRGFVAWAEYACSSWRSLGGAEMWRTLGGAA